MSLNLRKTESSFVINLEPKSSSNALHQYFELYEICLNQYKRAVSTSCYERQLFET